MTVEGILLKFDVKNKNNLIIPKDCKIDIPEVIPVVYGFDFSDPNKILGWAKVTRNDDNLSLFAELFDTPEVKKVVKVGSGVGGYFNKIVTTIDKMTNEQKIESMLLRACSIVEHPVNDIYRITEAK